MKPSTRRVVMAKEVAERWLSERVSTEYRLRVLLGGQGIKNLPGLMRAFRDRRAHLHGISAFDDFGVREWFDYVDMWSRNYGGLVQLRDWFETKGFETSGIW